MAELALGAGLILLMGMARKSVADRDTRQVGQAGFPSTAYIRLAQNIGGRRPLAPRDPLYTAGSGIQPYYAADALASGAAEGVAARLAELRTMYNRVPEIDKMRERVLGRPAGDEVSNVSFPRAEPGAHALGIHSAALDAVPRSMLGGPERDWRRRLGLAV